MRDAETMLLIMDRRQKFISVTSSISLIDKCLEIG